MTRTSQSGNDIQPTHVLDVLIIGGGFSGLYALDRLRDQGQDVKIWDAADDFGGIWWWNCYPGARTDSTGQVYQFSHKGLWKDYNFRELFPDYAGVREYLQYVDEQLDLRKDIVFSTFAQSASWDEDTCLWTVTSQDGKIQQSRFVIIATGFGAKPLYPNIEGADTFAGQAHHTARWPQDGLDMSDKKVVVMGTGASGLQVIQEAAAVASELTVLQRTPNIALPMRQRKLTPEDNEHYRKELPARFATRARSFAGFDFNFIPRNALDDTEEERNAEYEKMWAAGGFEMWLGNYQDVLTDLDANKTFYDFWRKKIHERVEDPNVAEILAPATPPHPFGVKRPSLEQNYYEVFNQDNVHLVDTNTDRIVEVVPEGVRVESGLIEADILVYATGFDANRGGIMAIDITGVNGAKLQEKWATKVESHFGVSTNGFPNMFFLYGPQSPAGFCNGPTSAEEQGDILVELFDHIQRNGFTRVESSREAEVTWTDHLDEIFQQSLFPLGKSWYWGANVPGKPAQMLNYCGGLPAYFDQWEEDKAKGYASYEFKKTKDEAFVA